MLERTAARGRAGAPAEPSWSSQAGPPGWEWGGVGDEGDRTPKEKPIEEGVGYGRL